MSELDDRLASLRDELARATRPDFPDVLRRRRRTVLRRGALATAATAAAVAAVLLVGGRGDTESLKVPVTVPASTAPASPTASALPLPVSPTPRAQPNPPLDLSQVTFAPDGTLFGLLNRCQRTDQGMGQCASYVERWDGAGAGWRIVGSPPPSPGGDYATLVAADARDLWYSTTFEVAGKVATHVDVSHDAGATWHPVAVNAGNLAAAGGTVWAAGCPTPSSCRTYTGPASGNVLTAGAPTGVPMAGLLAVQDARTAYVASSDATRPTFAATTDGGRSWRTGRLPCGLNPPLGFSPSSSPFAVSPDGTLWALCAGEPGAGSQLKSLYRSTDGGRTWQHEPDPETFGYAMDLTALSSTTAWRAGGRAPLYRTDDGGATWHADLADVFNTAFATPAFVAALDASTAATSVFDTAYRTSDGGRTWQRSDLALPPTRSLVPADSATPNAPCTAPQPGPEVTITIGPDAPTPRCAAVRPDQRIRVVNRTNGFGRPGQAIMVTFADFEPRMLAVGDTTVYDQPVGGYLAPGVHDVQLLGLVSAEVWLKP